MHKCATKISFKMIKLIFFLFFVVKTESANILCVFPTPAYSHQSVFNVYMDKLVDYGHNVTVITPVPRRVSHLKEIIVPNNTFEQLVNNSAMVVKEDSVTAEKYTPLIDIVAEQFASENVSKLVSSDTKFDLVVCEAYLTLPLVFGHVFQAPTIRFSSGYGTNENFYTMNKNGVDFNSVMYPNMWRSGNFGSTNDFYIENRLDEEWTALERVQDEKVKKLFGNYVPPLKVLAERNALLFVNVPAVLNNNRPVGDNVQYLGGLHLSKRSNPLRNYELGRHKNVVYVSFGSVATVFDNDTMTEMVRVFNSLPYTVYWKTNDRSDLGKNILTRKWFPQRELLNYGNIKLFITQGGVQSTSESIEAGVPMLVLPLMGDQFYNAHRLVQLGVAETVDILGLKNIQLENKIIHMMTNTKYAEQTKKLKQVINDLPMKSYRRAIWYTNRVLRFKMKTL
uniref:Ecdysteroid UDP-glucosyltransferase n=2 Tax=Betabaculovirus TaxID=558017 RepID=G4WEN3_9BBAC|nr:ecdysteroid glucosyl transferase [Phthorimaea operculella granulovirus]AYU75368.1 ecdysteroid UDP-glucosyltransferase [Phthorimaea operculella granulovirus]